MSKRSRGFVFTRNYKDTPVNQIPVKLDIDMERYKVQTLAYQLEQGAEGTPHYQGLIIFKHPRTFRGVQKILSGAHIEPMRGTPLQAFEYATKNESRIREPVILGNVPTGQGRRMDIEDYRDLILETPISRDDLIIEHPRETFKYMRYMGELMAIREKRLAQARYKLFVDEGCPEIKKEVIVIYGPSGTGKTSFVHRNHSEEDIYTLNFGDGTSGSLWFDGYNQENVLLLDDFYGQIRYNYLLRLLDVYALRVQSKGSYIYVNFPIIYITSNTHPSDWYQGGAVDGTKDSLMRRITKIIPMLEVGGRSITPNFCALSEIFEESDSSEDEN